MSASEFLTGDYENAARHSVEAIQKAPSTGWLALSQAHLVLANILYAKFDSDRFPTNKKPGRSRVLIALT
jgi:hypothetical protein